MILDRNDIPAPNWVILYPGEMYLMQIPGQINRCRSPEKMTLPDLHGCTLSGIQKRNMHRLPLKENYPLLITKEWRDKLSRFLRRYGKKGFRIREFTLTT
jgi:hypothetical protein